MSIDVHVHSSIDVADTQAVVDRLRREHPRLFTEQFYLRDASATSDFRARYLEREFGFRARSGFVVRLVDKEHADLAGTIRLIRSQFDDGQTLSLFENESIFPPVADGD